MLSFLASIASFRTTPRRSASLMVIDRRDDDQLPGWAQHLLAELGD